MKIKLLSGIIVVLLLVSCNKKGTELPEIKSDSLALYINRGKNPEDANAYKYTRRAFKIVESTKNDSVSRSKLFQIANNYFILEKLDDFKKTNEVIVSRSVEAKDTVDIAKAYRYKAEYYKAIQRNDSAFTFYIKAEKFYKKLDDKVNLGKIFYKKGIAQFDVGDLTGADLSITQAYTLLKDTDDKQVVYSTLSMTGIIAYSLEDYDKAIEYHKKALEIVKEYDLDPSLTQEESTLNNIGGVYQNLGQNLEAIANFNAALKSPDLQKLNPELYARLLDNLAYSKLKLKDFSQLPELFYTALEIREANNLKSSVISSKIHISEFYAETKDTVQALKYSLQALKLAKEANSPIDKLTSLKQLANVDHNNSTSYTKEYIALNDSLQQAERKSKDKFARIQLETNELESEKDKLAEQNRNLLYFFIGTFMIGMLLFVIRSQRAKNRELLLKQAQQKANEDIYNLMISQQNNIEESRIREKKRIAQELHDGVLGRLFGARLNLDSLNRMGTEEAAAKRNEYLTELKNIEQDIREISHDLNREKYVLINNFVAILNNLVEEQRNSFEPEVLVNIDERIQWETLSNTSKINLYRIIQESLQNINKYANATTIKVEIKKVAENLVLNVSDNGAGFAVNTKKKGIGLSNMVSRTHELNGTFDVRSKKGKGTTISVTVPIQAEQVPA